MIANKSIIFWCCKRLGYRCFKQLLKIIISTFPEVKIAAVIISEDDSYHKKIRALALKHDIKIFNNNQPMITQADLGICIGFPQKITSDEINRCRNGIINLHFAPLPNYRGSGTLSQAIVNQEKKYGLTFHYIDEEIDTGPVIAVKWIDLPIDKTAQEISNDLEKVGEVFFRQYIGMMIVSRLPSHEQDVLVTKMKLKPVICTRKSTRALLILSLDWPFSKIYRYVRALSYKNKPKPFFEYGGKKLFVSLT